MWRGGGGKGYRLVIDILGKGAESTIPPAAARQPAIIVDILVDSQKCSAVGVRQSRQSP